MAQILAGSDVRAILCGHLYHQMAATIAGIPVHVAPGIVTRIDRAGLLTRLTAVHCAGAAIAEFGTERAPTTYTIASHDPRAGEVVYRLDASSV